MVRASGSLEALLDQVIDLLGRQLGGLAGQFTGIDRKRRGALSPRVFLEILRECSQQDRSEYGDRRNGAEDEHAHVVLPCRRSSFRQ